MRLLSSIRIVRVSLALAVAFWMAGAGCLLGCENMVTAAATDLELPASSQLVVASGEACAAMHSHDCCAKRSHASSSKVAANAASVQSGAKTNDQLESVAQIPGTMIDCPLAVNATAALSKARTDLSAVALLSSSALSPHSNSPEQTSAFVRPLRLPNRGHTYLQCCVFLI
jgi:hypothetical protein